uniref:Uncharacterized protein n=1 Tax=Arundo donax TaxID=35708 RepID=A0A0A8Z6L5_ARUDO
MARSSSSCTSPYSDSRGGTAASRTPALLRASGSIVPPPVRAPVMESA